MMSNLTESVNEPFNNDDNDGEKINNYQNGTKKERKEKVTAYSTLETDPDDGNSKSTWISAKGRPFKFVNKVKEKRDKSRDKDTNGDKKKERFEKKSDRERVFGVPLEKAVERCRCHDGIRIPLPVRQCIDCIEELGLSFEYVYKTTGNKSKVMHLIKLYNNHRTVNLLEQDISTVTSLLKAFIRGLPESMFTQSLLLRFEEAGAILNDKTRIKHLNILLDSIPDINKECLAWCLIHFSHVCSNEGVNKMSQTTLSSTLCNTFHCSARLMNALIKDAPLIFPNLSLHRYVPPLSANSLMPIAPDLIEIELAKQESLLSQLHREVNIAGGSADKEEQLWEVQRIVTHLRRNLKDLSKSKFAKSTESYCDAINPQSHIQVASSSQAPLENSISTTSEEAKCHDSTQMNNHDIQIKRLERLNTELRNWMCSLAVTITSEANRTKILNQQLHALRNERNCSDIINSTKFKGKLTLNFDSDMSLSALRKENVRLQLKRNTLLSEMVQEYEFCLYIKAQLA